MIDIYTCMHILANGQPSQCPVGWTHNQASCYFISPAKRTWSDAAVSHFNYTLRFGWLLILSPYKDFYFNNFLYVCPFDYNDVAVSGKVERS